MQLICYWYSPMQFHSITNILATCIQRFYEIEDSRRKYIMNRLGMLLRNFRRKFYAKYIEPNLGNTAKLKRIPKRYSTIILSQDHWDKFVEHTQSHKFKVKFIFYIHYHFYFIFY